MTRHPVSGILPTKLHARFGTPSGTQLGVFDLPAFSNKGNPLIIRVFDNQIEKALKVMKRQMAKEGLMKELKRRAFYEKPSVKRKRKQRDAKKKRLKALKRARASVSE